MKNVLKKSVIMIIFCVLSTLVLNATSSYYQVISNDGLYVYSEATTQSEIIALLEPGEEIIAYESLNWGTWSKVYVNGQYGYVPVNGNLKYLRPHGEVIDNTLYEFFPDLKQYKNKDVSEVCVWFAIAAFIISAFVIFILSKFKDINDVMLWVAGVAFAICSLSEMVYFMTSPIPMWFCWPRNVGWLWMIINFITFGVVTILQIILYIRILTEIENLYEHNYRLNVSMISIPIFLIVFIVMGYFWPENMDTMLLIGGALLLIQILIILYESNKQRNIKVGFVSIAFFLIGLIGTVMMLTAFAILFIIAVIVLIALYIGLIALGAKSGSSNEDRYIYEVRENGWGPLITRVDRSGFGENGRHYSKDSNGNWCED